MPHKETSSFDRLIARIEALPEAGEGMTVDEIAQRADSDSSSVVAALQEIVEREESPDRPEGDN